MERLDSLFKKMKKRFGNRIDSLDRVADLLIDEGYVPTPVTPRFADMPSSEYRNGDLCLSFSLARSVKLEYTDNLSSLQGAPEEGHYLIMHARSESSSFLATLPLDDLNKYLKNSKEHAVN